MSRKAGELAVGTLDALDDQSSGGSAKDLGIDEAVDVRGDTSRGRAGRRPECGCGIQRADRRVEPVCAERATYARNGSKSATTRPATKLALLIHRRGFQTQLSQTGRSVFPRSALLEVAFGENLEAIQEESAICRKRAFCPDWVPVASWAIRQSISVHG